MNLMAPTICRRCCGPLESNEPCLSCWAAEDVARDMSIPVEEMLAVARAQWQLPEEGTGTLGIQDDTEVQAGERVAVLSGR